MHAMLRNEYRHTNLWALATSQNIFVMTIQTNSMSAATSTVYIICDYLESTGYRFAAPHHQTTGDRAIHVYSTQTICWCTTKHTIFDNHLQSFHSMCATDRSSLSPSSPPDFVCVILAAMRAALSLYVHVL